MGDTRMVDWRFRDEQSLPVDRMMVTNDVEGIKLKKPRPTRSGLKPSVAVQKTANQQTLGDGGCKDLYSHPLDSVDDIRNMRVAGSGKTGLEGFKQDATAQNTTYNQRVVDGGCKDLYRHPKNVDDFTVAKRPSTRSQCLEEGVAMQGTSNHQRLDDISGKDGHKHAIDNENGTSDLVLAKKTRSKGSKQGMAVHGITNRQTTGDVRYGNLQNYPADILEDTDDMGVAKRTNALPQDLAVQKTPNVHRMVDRSNINYRDQQNYSVCRTEDTSNIVGSKGIRATSLKQYMDKKGTKNPPNGIVKRNLVAEGQKATTATISSVRKNQIIWKKTSPKIKKSQTRSKNLQTISDVQAVRNMNIPPCPTQNVGLSNQSMRHPATCSFCGKYYTRKENCLVHEKCVHLGLKPYKCQLCGSAFGYARNLREHKNKCNIASVSLRNSRRKRAKAISTKRNKKQSKKNGDQNKLTLPSRDNEGTRSLKYGSHFNRVLQSEVNNTSGADSDNLSKIQQMSQLDIKEMCLQGSAYKSARKFKQGSSVKRSRQNKEVTSRLKRESPHQKCSQNEEQRSKVGSGRVNTRSQNVNANREVDTHNVEAIPEIDTQTFNANHEVNTKNVKENHGVDTQNVKVNHEVNIGSLTESQTQNPSKHDTERSQSLGHLDVPRVSKTLSKPEVSRSQRQSPVPGTCTYCGKMFTRKENARIHEKTVHLKLKPFVCGYCNKAFNWPDQLYRHRKQLHENEKSKHPKTELCATKVRKGASKRKQTCDTAFSDTVSNISEGSDTVSKKSKGRRGRGKMQIHESGNPKTESRGKPSMGCQANTKQPPGAASSDATTKKSKDKPTSNSSQKQTLRSTQTRSGGVVSNKNDVSTARKNVVNKIEVKIHNATEICPQQSLTTSDEMITNVGAVSMIPVQPTCVPQTAPVSKMPDKSHARDPSPAFSRYKTFNAPVINKQSGIIPDKSTTFNTDSGSRGVGMSYTTKEMDAGIDANTHPCCAQMSSNNARPTQAQKGSCKVISIGDSSTAFNADYTTKGATKYRPATREGITKEIPIDNECPPLRKIVGACHHAVVDSNRSLHTNKKHSCYVRKDSSEDMPSGNKNSLALKGVDTCIAIDTSVDINKLHTGRRTPRDRNPLASPGMPGVDACTTEYDASVDIDKTHADKSAPEEPSNENNPNSGTSRDRNLLSTNGLNTSTQSSLPLKRYSKEIHIGHRIPTATKTIDTCADTKASLHTDKSHPSYTQKDNTSKAHPDHTEQDTSEGVSNVMDQKHSWICDVCEMEFVGKKHLVYHQRCHDGDEDRTAKLVDGQELISWHNCHDTYSQV